MITEQLFTHDFFILCIKKCNINTYTHIQANVQLFDFLEQIFFFISYI